MNKNIPQHLAIIMDGNGRWANKRALPRRIGHKKGLENVEKISDYARSRGVKVLSLFAFSTENWLRPKGEVDFLESSFLPRESAEITLQKPEEIKGTRARLLKAYTEAMGMVEATTRVSMKPYMTLREFLKEVTPGLNNAKEPFIELTRLAEDALYSPDMPEADDITRAENLALIIKEMLKHGSV